MELELETGEVWDCRLGELGKDHTDGDQHGRGDYVEKYRKNEGFINMSSLMTDVAHNNKQHGEK